MNSSIEIASREILEKAKLGTETPQDWVVFPLLRQKLLLAMAGWIFGIILGLGLFVLLGSIVIPYNYQHGVGPAIFSTLLLGLLLFVGLGSMWALWIDIRRLQQSDTHLLVITPNDFVKQEGKKIIHVPLMHVRHVTARGARPPEKGQREKTIPNASENLTGVFFGRAVTPSGIRRRRQRMRAPTTLAFIDSRTDNEIMVVTDEAYGDPFTIAAFLKEYATRAQDIA